MEVDIERQEGKREVEKFVHGLRNGEIVGGAARERRMRHATREGNRPSFWTYLMVSGCMGLPEAEEGRDNTPCIKGKMRRDRKKQE
eukprot:6193409-Pleurochrysis_carterae.AAC.2